MADLDPFDEYSGPAKGDEQEPRSALGVLAMIKDYEKSFDKWQKKCDRIDKLYSSLQSLSGVMPGANGQILDREYNLFWASVEVIKPSIYSRAPVPVVVPKFKDRNPVKRVTSELLERSAISGFDLADMNDVMLNVRDDLVINARGVIWLSYETTEDSDADYEKVCIEHLDRHDFGHEWGRKWSEVGIVWRHAWLTVSEGVDRFGEKARNANYGKHKEELGDGEKIAKARFSEVWNKRENKVQWVAEGVDTFLEEDDPHLKLRGFFPCPKPAYGTTERATLRPVPDISYIEDQLDTINELTVRIHDLCNKLVVKGLIPAGTDAGDAVEMAMRQENASYMLIPVPAMSMTDGAQVQWLPIDQVAQAILAAVQARRELIGNVQELFGIADIMRGDTEAQETLGAQQLKAQYGSVRIRDRVNELVRIAKDTVEIMAEIMAEEFSLDTLLMMSQMELPTDAEIKKQIKELEAAAKKELEALASQAEQALQSPEAQENPQEAEQQFQQAQQQILGKYSPQLQKLQQATTQEMVKKLLRDDKTRPFVFDIETDSTIYPDEQAEKQSRNEFMTAFTTASAALAPLVQTGPAGAKMAGELIKFQLGPYRAGRQLEGMIDEWVESLENMPQQDNGAAEAQQALAQSQLQLAQAELQKAQAQTMKVEADAQGKTQQLQLQMAEAQAKQQSDEQRFMLEVEQTKGSIAETQAKIEKLYAEIQKIGVDAQNQTRQQDRDDFKATTEVQFRAEDQARQVEQTAFDQSQQMQNGQRMDRGEDRADRQQGFSERQGERQQSLAEKQAESGE